MYFCNHYFFRTYTFDYGGYNFAFFDFAHLRNSISPVYQEQMKFIQDHVSFTLIIFVPLYWLLSWLTGTYTLLFIQTLIILFGAWGVYKLVELKSNSKILPVLAGLYYFLILGRWTTFISDCNFAIMASSIVPVFMYYFEKRKWIPAALSFLFILTTREDMALWTLFIGLFFLVEYRKEKMARWASLLVVFVSLAYFIVVFKVFIPAIETPERVFRLFNYSVLGEGPSEALIFMIKHPLKTLSLLFTNWSGDPLYNGVKAEFYLVYLLSGGLLLFLRPKYLLLFIPILAKKMLNDDPIRWSVELYYSIEFVSILPVAVYLIIASLRNKKLQTNLGLLVCTVTLFMTMIKFNYTKRAIPWWSDPKYSFHKTEMYSSGFNTSRVHDLINEIPETAIVSASNKILPHLAFREKIYFFPKVEDAEYLVVFTENNIFPLNQEEFNQEMEKYLNSTDWEIIAEEEPLLILRNVK